MSVYVRQWPLDDDAHLNTALAYAVADLTDAAETEQVALVGPHEWRLITFAGRLWLQVTVPAELYDGMVADEGLVVDEVAVRRAVLGQPQKLTRPERVEAVRVMSERGHSTTQIARRLRLSGASVRRLMEVS